MCSIERKISNIHWLEDDYYWYVYTCVNFVCNRIFFQEKERLLSLWILGNVHVYAEKHHTQNRASTVPVSYRLFHQRASKARMTFQRSPQNMHNIDINVNILLFDSSSLPLTFFDTLSIISDREASMIQKTHTNLRTVLDSLQIHEYSMFFLLFSNTFNKCVLLLD